MKFTEIIERLLPGATTWTEEEIAEARVSLAKATPVFDDLLDEDGAAVEDVPTGDTSASTTGTPDSTSEVPASTAPPIEGSSAGSTPGT